MLCNENDRIYIVSTHWQWLRQLGRF